MNKDIRERGDVGRIGWLYGEEDGKGKLSLYPKALGLGILYTYNRKLDR